MKKLTQEEAAQRYLSRLAYLKAYRIQKKQEAADFKAKVAKMEALLEQLLAKEAEQAAQKEEGK